MNNLPIIPGRGLVTKSSTQMRLDFLQSVGIKTEKIAVTNMDIEDVQNNIESYIGTTEIPLGIVGPLLYKEANNEELVYCPATTLEGALIASMNRGAKVLSKSGGFSAQVIWQKMTRSPMFLFGNKEESSVFKNFIETNKPVIKEVAANYSNHAKLHEIQIVLIDTVVHLKFVYITGDASGQNMTTSCTWHAMLYIVKNFIDEKGIVPLDYVIEGNGACDKKVSYYNINSGRGIRVIAECCITEKVINEVLRTTSQKLINCFYPSKQLAEIDGMIGYNINVANAIAAIFAATGQDLASIHESSLGILHLEKNEGGLKFSLTLPNLVIGTVGGGTRLPKQGEALEIMKCSGTGKVERFAKLIAGFALGLEISTYAAIVSGEFAKAHEKLGRNKPVKWLLRSELTQDFIQASLNGFFKDKVISNIQLTKSEVFENGIINIITAKASKKLIGFIPIKVEYKESNKCADSRNLLIKSKPLDEEVIKGLHLLAASIDPNLSDLLNQSQGNLEYKNCHLKELELYKYLHNKNFKNIPFYYGSHVDSKREIYLLIQEYLEYSSFKIINSENHPERWGQKDILTTIDVIVAFHKDVDVSEFKNVQVFKPWKSAELYKKLLSILIKECDNYNDLIHLKSLFYEIDNLEEEEKLINLDKTIIHNDFNPRNVAVKNDGAPVIYDWELATIDFPHRDIVEFLSFVLPENFSKDDLFYYLKYHYRYYPSSSWTEWLRAYRYSLKVYIISRISFYEVSGILVKYDFSKRVLNTAFRMLNCIKVFEMDQNIKQMTIAR